MEYRYYFPDVSVIVTYLGLPSVLRSSNKLYTVPSLVTHVQLSGKVGMR